MMSILKDAISAVDPAPDKKTELTLALNLLSELAENKAMEFENEIAESYRTAGTSENRTVPITFIVASHKEYRAYVKDDAGKIADEVAEAIKKFVTGSAENIISGIADLVSTGLAAILGEGTATNQEMRSYYITAQSSALIRYDIYGWRRLVEATGITSKIESCLAVYASKASIDVLALDLNTFLIAYEDQLSKLGIPANEILTYLNEAEKIYNKLRENAGGSPTVSGSSSRANPRLKGPGQFVFAPDFDLPKTRTRKRSTIHPQIYAALPNPENKDSGQEWIELLNPGNASIDLSNYALADRQGNLYDLSQLAATQLSAKETIRIYLPEGNPIQLANSGDDIQLIYQTKTVHKVSYAFVGSGEILNFENQV